MSLRMIAVPFALVFAGACASAGPDPVFTGKQEAAVARAEDKVAKPEAGPKPEDKALKRANLERQLALETQKHAKAELDLANQDKTNAETIKKAEAELAFAQARLEHFIQGDMRNRLDSAKLSLQQAKDGNEEAKEELAQLEIMYKEQDLADKTREIVINRGRRRLDRTADRLAIQQREVDHLEKNTLPDERTKLDMEVADKRREVERARRSAEVSVLEKRIALKSSENELARIQGEIEALTR